MGAGRPFSLMRFLGRLGFWLGVVVLWIALLAAYKGLEWVYNTVVGWFA